MAGLIERLEKLKRISGERGVLTDADIRRIMEEDEEGVLTDADIKRRKKKAGERGALTDADVRRFKRKKK